jgi:Ca2+-binding EF-hand superfamily protein
MLFGIYDVDGSGGISYKEFCDGVFGRPSTAASTGGSVNNAGSVKTTGTGVGTRDPEALAEVLKTKLASRGARGMIGLQKQFKIMDDDNSKNLNNAEFTKALTDYKLGFSKAECLTLFNYFDVDTSGSITYDEFIRAIRGPMNMARKKIVAQAYKKLDKDGNGWIDLDDVRGVYKCNKHPDVISGKKTEDQILQEFLETFETAHNMRNNSAPDYVVTKEEFEEYYNNISCSIDDDMYFMAMISSAWKLTEESMKGQGTKGWSAEQPRAKQDNNIFDRPAPKKV